MREFTAFFVCILFGAALMTGCASTLTPPTVRYRVPIGDSPVMGGETAAVTITLFARFNQKADKALFEAITELHMKSPEATRILFKHRPGSDKAAQEAAIASMAAQKQGLFWPYAKRVFTGNQGWKSDALFAYATDAGLNLDLFREDVNNPLYPVRINADDSVAVKFQASAAPAVLFNGRAVSPKPQALRPALEQELRKAKRLMALGADREQLSALLTEMNLLSPTPITAARPTGRRQHRIAPEKDNTIYRVTYEKEHMAIGASEEEALITVVVFNDYQCPFCKRLEPTLKGLVEKYPKVLRVVYRHNPLPMHKQAKAGAIAAVAANAQGKGLLFHERIFEQPRNLAEADLLTMARELKLKLKTFEKNRKRSSETVAKDMSDAKSLGATGTPTSFLNGRRITGAKSLSTFITITDQELIRARAAQDKHGLKGHPLYKFLTTP